MELKIEGEIRPTGISRTIPAENREYWTINRTKMYWQKQLKKLNSKLAKA